MDGGGQAKAQRLQQRRGGDSAQREDCSRVAAGCSAASVVRPIWTKAGTRTLKTLPGGVALHPDLKVGAKERSLRQLVPGLAEVDGRMTAERGIKSGLV